MYASSTLRQPVSDRAFSLVIVVGLHLAAGTALLMLAQPVIQQLLAEPVRIELITAPNREQTAPEPPKPIEPQVQPQRVAPAPRPVAAPLLQTEAPIQPNTPVIEAAPAPKEAPTAVLNDSTAQTRAAPGPAVPAAAEAVQAPRFDADYLHNPSPAYPPASRSLGEEGRVLLRVQVSEDGRALQVLIDAGSGFARLDRAARDAVAAWRFVPARQGQQAVSGWVKVPVVFELKR
ncbi:hypothetical protein GCM10027046_33480 [Uliginosibacterium flavum]|uniref:TonB family protein n=1 Tax=Uliginosibacterium flavum TaxID=1396831 RepID=A0ABV2TPB0_9RHOO